MVYPDITSRELPWGVHVNARARFRIFFYVSHTQYARSAFFIVKQKFKNLTRKKRRKFESELNANLQILSKKNPKKFWKKISHLKGNSNLFRFTTIDNPKAMG